VGDRRSTERGAGGARGQDGGKKGLDFNPRVSNRRAGAGGEVVRLGAEAERVSKLPARPENTFIFRRRAGLWGERRYRSEGGGSTPSVPFLLTGRAEEARRRSEGTLDPKGEAGWQVRAKRDTSASTERLTF